MGYEVIRHCHYYAIMAEIKMGEMLAMKPRVPGPGRGKKTSAPTERVLQDVPTLSELKITPKESSQAKALAALPQVFHFTIFTGK